jgi:His-Xaa-Ser system radical SAM maturase HxsC
MIAGLNHTFTVNNQIRLYTYDGYIVLDDEAEEILSLYVEDDVLSIDEKGIIYCLYNSKSDDNAIVFTMQCNSNCIMCPCSENSRKNGVLSSGAELIEIMKYIPDSVRHLTLTGGEPTLLKEGFFEFLKYAQNNFGGTHFQLLTNGRAFGDYKFTERFIDCIPDNIDIGIPIYGYNSETHDSITRAQGSFKETIIGVHNLLHYNIEIELRIVLTKLNVDYLDKIAQYIVKYLSGVNKVAFMGLELMGNAAKNMKDVWVPYEVAAKKSEKAIKYLIANGINVQLFNIPLCMVPENLWDICIMSITDYKIKYNDGCESCAVKDICGGMFESTQRMAKIQTVPIIN